MVKYYRAFGFVIQSEIEISMLQPIEECAEVDVRIVRGTLEENYENTETLRYFPTRSGGNYLIRGGDHIVADVLPETPLGLISAFILGTCMGVIMIQRGFFLLHGSCVTKGDDAILITGMSGAGKSTLAAEFLRNGWKLLTDDVSKITGIEEGIPIVHSSYPSQKLWEDAMNRYQNEDASKALYEISGKEKYSVHVSNYIEGEARLRAVVRLFVTDNRCELEMLDGFAKVDQLVKNTYRYSMLPDNGKQLHFQRCVTLSSQIQMYVAARAKEYDSAKELYEKIIKVME